MLVALHVLQNENMQNALLQPTPPQLTQVDPAHPTTGLDSIIQLTRLQHLTQAKILLNQTAPW